MPSIPQQDGLFLPASLRPKHIVIPITSYPFLSKIPAATEESTPPDIATTTLAFTEKPPSFQTRIGTDFQCGFGIALFYKQRSEERRVGEECRSRWSPD